MSGLPDDTQAIFLLSSPSSLPSPLSGFSLRSACFPHRCDDNLFFRRVSFGNPAAQLSAVGPNLFFRAAGTPTFFVAGPPGRFRWACGSTLFPPAEKPPPSLTFHHGRSPPPPFPTEGGTHSFRTPPKRSPFPRLPLARRTSVPFSPGLVSWKGLSFFLRSRTPALFPTLHFWSPGVVAGLSLTPGSFLPRRWRSFFSELFPLSAEPRLFFFFPVIA